MNAHDYVAQRIQTFLQDPGGRALIIRTPPRFGKTTIATAMARLHQGAVEYRVNPKLRKEFEKVFENDAHITVGESLFPSLVIHDDYYAYGVSIKAPATVIIGSEWPRIVPHWTWEIINIPAIWDGESTIPEIFNYEEMRDMRDSVSATAWVDMWQGALR